MKKSTSKYIIIRGVYSHFAIWIAVMLILLVFGIILFVKTDLNLAPEVRLIPVWLALLCIPAMFAMPPEKLYLGLCYAVFSDDGLRVYRRNAVVAQLNWADCKHVSIKKASRLGERERYWICFCTDGSKCKDFLVFPKLSSDCICVCYNEAIWDELQGRLNTGSYAAVKISGSKIV